VLVLDVVGLTPRILRSGDAPRLDALPGRTGVRAALTPVLPAVTCSVQATLLTGLMPSGHGIVGNGWYFRDLAEAWLWRQSAHLVAGPNVWEAADATAPGASPRVVTPCAKLFWWYNMHSTAAWSVTPRPVYPADGRKIPDIYTQPPALRERLQAELGAFPLFHFWGPTADIRSTEWIASATAIVLREQRPDLCLSYLPHLDYDLQRHGPDDGRSSQAARDVDRVAGDLVDEARGLGYDIVVLSEYGITAVRGPVHVNRALRDSTLRASYEFAQRRGCL
jgi:predicted AlkP superfamily pyrophosphatase or phosphodiesterase